MRKFCLTYFLLFTLISFADATFTAGTFNIRYKTTKDVDEYHWDVRKTYVVRTITELGFDVIGLNEMNAGSMYDYLKEELGSRGFEMAVSGFRSSSKDPESYYIHPIVYRAEMFDLLDKGAIFLNIDTSTPGQSWDNSTNQRGTYWAKLRVKETGDVFFYFATHLDHSGQLARNEQSRINIEKVKEIAGEYPVIIAGDHNSTISRPPFYNLYASYLEDTMYAAETPFADKIEGTLCSNFLPSYNGSRLDYIWVRGFKVHTHEHIRETFGATILPSDHIAVRSKLTLQSNQEGLWESHLNPGAAIEGDGSAEAPFTNFALALERTRRGGTIKVVAGAIERENENVFWEVNKSVTIIGGYNDTFTEVVGVSSMTGDNTCRLITVDKSSYLELNNFELSGGNSDSMGGGIYSLGAYLHLHNVTITDCHAKTAGGAIYAAQQIKTERCRFERNTTDGNGGAVMCDYTGNYPHFWWRYRFNNTEFAENSASIGSAVYIKHMVRTAFVDCAFIGNTASTRGTVDIDGTRYDCETSFANCTFAQNTVEASTSASDAAKGGSAVFARLKEGSIMSLMNCTIIGNKCQHSGEAKDDYAASTVMMPSGKLYIYSTLIGGNTTDAIGAKSDISVPAAVGAFNCYSCAANISHKKSITDIISAGNDDALAKFKAIFDCDTDEDGLLLPEIALNGGFTRTAVMKSTKYGFDDLNNVPKTQFEEALTHADLNDDAELKGTMTEDQRGFERRRNGTSTIGATEFDEDFDSTPLVDADCAIAWHLNGRELTAISERGLNLYDITGCKVDQTKGGCEMKVNVKPGLYILNTDTQSIKIMIK